MGHCKVFYPIYEKYIKKHQDDIVSYINSLKEKNKIETLRVSVYNMKCTIDYENILKETQEALKYINKN